VSSSPSARARRRCSARRLRGGVREQRYQQPSRARPTRPVGRRARRPPPAMFYTSLDGRRNR
jgi:hypothetical protein